MLFNSHRIESCLCAAGNAIDAPKRLFADRKNRITIKWNGVLTILLGFRAYPSAKSSLRATLKCPCYVFVSRHFLGRRQLFPATCRKFGVSVVASGAATLRDATRRAASEIHQGGISLLFNDRERAWRKSVGMFSLRAALRRTTAPKYSVSIV